MMRLFRRPPSPSEAEVTHARSEMERTVAVLAACDAVREAQSRQIRALADELKRMEATAAENGAQSDYWRGRALEAEAEVGALRAKYQGVRDDLGRFRVKERAA